MTAITYTLIADGTSDRVLANIIDWVIRTNHPELNFFQNFAPSSQLGKGNLAEKVRRALGLYPCDILFVHRDSELADGYQARVDEISEATGTLDVACVPIVPVRMTEAWLLFSEKAIRTAAGNPNGRLGLNLPNLRNADRIPDPKEILFQKLRDATELSARRLSRFSETDARARVAEVIEDFSPLRVLNSFQSFERDTNAAIGTIP